MAFELYESFIFWYTCKFNVHDFVDTPFSLSLLFMCNNELIGGREPTGMNFIRKVIKYSLRSLI